MNAHQCVYVFMCGENGQTGFNEFFIAYCNSLERLLGLKLPIAYCLKGKVRDAIATHTAEEG